ncbi:hypothetical protein [Streptomyces griseiscabiei]|uniref:Uncharacterized protein n=1 Tax=Streptomyces griseiscabiei TaxID=2993540 RepID=A0ABU4LKL3_9ACTN|nr:hypothetical protein [Streptomyces griseiscabiei]MBZ3906551.1 hypothetical protein [Streptomyces griseiscabiei]MDX2916158.1 hypothetical protein [Streptomyces griseiscabiei]
MSSGDTGLNDHPAGWDDALRRALEDLHVGRWLSTRELLLKTGRDWELRTARSQVLATVAVRSGAVGAWREEEPGSADALVMAARVMTQRALLSARAGVGLRQQARVCDLAREACRRAMPGADPYDPVPQVCLLALAQMPCEWQVPDRYRPELFGEPPESSMLPRGPWPQLGEVLCRDPDNREALQRMLQYFHARGAGGFSFAQWEASRAKAGSVRLMLPLYALTHSYRRQLADGAVVSRFGFWARGPVRYHAERALREWFDVVQSAECSLLDLNHLAYVLSASGEQGAGRVFEAIGPYATAAPWKQLQEESSRRDTWQDDFLRARAYAWKQKGRAR